MPSPVSTYNIAIKIYLSFSHWHCFRIAFACLPYICRFGYHGMPTVIYRNRRTDKIEITNCYVHKNHHQRRTISSCDYRVRARSAISKWKLIFISPQINVIISIRFLHGFSSYRNELAILRSRSMFSVSESRAFAISIDMLQAVHWADKKHSR